ncbi:hypothetical protein ACFYY8_16330 [Streptosporangium sp. NPDC001559]|uniref:hypothetical protein n=1 Tax=Streptosporangium sp. NPDC001559 TaxID=3366187 RepID=UPI0036EB3062
MEVPGRLRPVPVRTDTAHDRAGCAVLVAIAALPVIALADWTLLAWLLDHGSCTRVYQGSMECGYPGMMEALLVAAPLTLPPLAVQMRLIALAVRRATRG